MKSRKVALPVIGAIAATRGLLGVGAGLLLSSRVSKRRRRRVGLTLLAIGAVSTVPLAALVLRNG